MLGHIIVLEEGENTQLEADTITDFDMNRGADYISRELLRHLWEGCVEV